MSKQNGSKAAKWRPQSEIPDAEVLDRLQEIENAIYLRTEGDFDALGEWTGMEDLLEQKRAAYDAAPTDENFKQLQEQMKVMHARRQARCAQLVKARDLYEGIRALLLDSGVNGHAKALTCAQLHPKAGKPKGKPAPKPKPKPKPSGPVYHDELGQAKVEGERTGKTGTYTRAGNRVPERPATQKQSWYQWASSVGGDVEPIGTALDLYVKGTKPADARQILADEQEDQPKPGKIWDGPPYAPTDADLVPLKEAMAAPPKKGAKKKKQAKAAPLAAASPALGEFDAETYGIEPEDLEESAKLVTKLREGNIGRPLHVDEEGSSDHAGTYAVVKVHETERTTRYFLHPIVPVQEWKGAFREDFKDVEHLLGWEVRAPGGMDYVCANDTDRIVAVVAKELANA